MKRTESTKRATDQDVRGQPRPDRAAVGERIAQARSNVAGLTQKELAAAVGVTHRAVQNWEAGSRSPVRHLRELEQALGVSREWLLWGTQKPPASELAHQAERLNYLEAVVERLTKVLAAALEVLEEHELAVGDLRDALPPPRDVPGGRTVDVVTGRSEPLVKPPKN